MVRYTVAILGIDGDGVLDVDRWSTQQSARAGDPFDPTDLHKGQRA